MTKLAQLERIAIQGFKSIGAADVELRPLNVLIGANGAGKSNFIAVFQMLNALIENGLQDFVAKADGANNLLYFSRKNTEIITLKLYFGEYGYQVKLAASDGDHLYFNEELCWRSAGAALLELHMGSGHRETQLNKPDRPQADHFDAIALHVSETLKSWRVYHFHDTSRDALVKHTHKINDNAFLRPDAANLAAMLYLLQQRYPEYYRKIVRTVQLVAPFFDDFVLRPAPLNPDNIRLEWREKGSDAYFNANMLSDGTLRFICLATLLLQPELPATLLIDEPELGLHPYAINLLAGLLRGASAQTQVIVTTQSVPLVNQFAPEDILLVEREQGQSAFKRIDEHTLEGWLEEYSLGELWEKNIIGGNPRRWEAVP